jgi:hypothetical protein
MSSPIHASNGKKSLRRIEVRFKQAKYQNAIVMKKVSLRDAASIDSAP